MFAAKPQLAGELLRHAARTGAVAHRVAGDEVHGGAGLRRLTRSPGTGYVMAVRGSHAVTTSPGTTMTVTAAARLLRARHWQRMRTGSGSKGAKDYNGAIVQVKPGDTPGGQAGEHDDGHSCPLLRRHRYTGTISCFRCRNRTGVPLAGLIEAAVRRWRTEEDHQPGKQAAGPDSGQARTWTSWHRWTALCLTACAFPALTTCAPARHQHPIAQPGAADPGHHPRTAPPDPRHRHPRPPPRPHPP